MFEIVGCVVAAGGTHVGALGRSEANESQVKKIRMCAVTAVVFTVYLVVVVGITTAPEAAEPHAAGETEFTAQFVVVLYVVEIWFLVAKLWPLVWKSISSGPA